MSSTTYYPVTTEGRAEWWQNIAANTAALTPLGFAAAEVTAITNDAAWAIFTYRDIRVLYEHYYRAVVSYADTVADGIGGTSGDALPPAPEPPEWPTAPTGVITCDFEKRREDWVRKAKASPAYTESLGEALRLIGSSIPFDPTNYTPELLSPMSQSPKTISGKFRKARGNVDGVILMGRKDGTSGWEDLGRFNATPFTASVPLANSGPELWEFWIQAFKRDVPFGNTSPVQQVIIKG